MSAYENATQGMKIRDLRLLLHDELACTRAKIWVDKQKQSPKVIYDRIQNPCWLSWFIMCTHGLYCDIAQTHEPYGHGPETCAKSKNKPICDEMRKRYPNPF